MLQQKSLDWAGGGAALQLAVNVRAGQCRLRTGLNEIQMKCPFNAVQQYMYPHIITNNNYYYDDDVFTNIQY